LVGRRRLARGNSFKQLIDTTGVGFGREEGFETGTTLKGLRDTIGRIEGFLLGAGAGIETGTATGVFRAIGIVGVIVGAVEIGAARGVVSSCARHGKTVS
jgi:hypothetical protein